MAVSTVELLDRIHARAREERPARALLNVTLAPLFLVGLTVGFVWRSVGVFLRYAFATVQIGFEAAKKDR